MGGFFGGNTWDYPSWMRDAGQSGYANYGNSLAQMYGPEAYQRAIAQYGENWDQQAGNSPWARTMSQNGFQGSPNTGLIRAGAMAQNRVNTRQTFNQGQLGGYQNQLGMLSGLSGLYHKTYSPGIGGAIAGLLGGLGGGGGMAAKAVSGVFGGGGSNAMGQTYGPMTQTPAGVSSPPNMSEGTNQSMGQTGQTYGFAPSYSANPGYAMNGRAQKSWYPPTGLNAYGYGGR